MEINAVEYIYIYIYIYMGVRVHWKCIHNI